MTDTAFSGWIKYLKHPLVLIGFVFMLITGIIKALIKQDIVSALGDTAAPIVTAAIYLIFILGALIVIVAIVVQKRNANNATSEGTDKIRQKTSSHQSPAIVTRGDKSSVKINYDSSGNSK